MRTPQAHNPLWYENSLQERVNLRDPKTFENSFFDDYMSLGAEELRSKITDTIGNALYYMIVWDPVSHWREGHGVHPSQYDEIVSFGRTYAREMREPDRWENIWWLRRQLYIILDMTENLV